MPLDGHHHVQHPSRAERRPPLALWDPAALAGRLGDPVSLHHRPNAPRLLEAGIPWRRGGRRVRKQATGRCHKSHRENNYCWHPAEREEPARHSRTCASHGVRGDHGALPLCPGRPRRREATEWRGGGRVRLEAPLPALVRHSDHTVILEPLLPNPWPTRAVAADRRSHGLQPPGGGWSLHRPLFPP